MKNCCSYQQFKKANRLPRCDQSLEIIRNLASHQIGEEFCEIYVFTFTVLSQYCLFSCSITWVVFLGGTSWKKKILSGEESNPGLPRDRRGYSSLYYRGFEHLRNEVHQTLTMFNPCVWLLKDCEMFHLAARLGRWVILSPEHTKYAEDARKRSRKRSSWCCSLTCSWVCWVEWDHADSV